MQRPSVFFSLYMVAALPTAPPMRTTHEADAGRARNPTYRGSTASSVAFVVAVALLPGAFAFSSGGGEDGREGSPAVQDCDAIYTCGSGVCPPGMTLVAPPERSDVYELRTGTGPSPATDATSYIPGELMPLYLRVTQQYIPGKAEAGATILRNESSKYIGLLLYAVRANDAAETKVGTFEVPLTESERFWTPPDSPGCNRHALMHAAPMAKHFLVMQQRLEPARIMSANDHVRKRPCTFLPLL